MISHKKKLSLRAACAAMCLAAAGAAHAQTYKLNLPMDDDPDTVLQPENLALADGELPVLRLTTIVGRR